MTGIAIELAERGFIPDFVTRLGIRRLLAQRLKRERKRAVGGEGKDALVAAMSASPLAVDTRDANEQHYEVPARFFELMLGPALKYSCALFENQEQSLAGAEEAMLALSCERAGLANGQSILELGCGWGALTLFMAARYPDSRIVAVSNSASQKTCIETRARREDVSNIEVVTCDMNEFSIGREFDRVVSIEMFEHMRNWKLLFHRIADWLRPDGRLFFHIFCHRNTPYFFQVESESDWMSEHFFTGGLMPSYDLPSRFEEDLRVRQQWEVNGTHYARTCRAWLERLDAGRADALRVLEESGNPESAVIQFNRWRMFVMACEELFACRSGKEWFVGHYLMER